jgi:hypothetical protein
MKHALEMYVKAKPITSETHLWGKKVNIMMIILILDR